MIIHDVHGGLGDDPKVTALAARRGHESAYQKLAEPFYWHSMVDDVKGYIKNCLTVNSKERFFETLVKNYKVYQYQEVLKKIGVDFVIYMRVMILNI